MHLNYSDNIFHQNENPSFSSGGTMLQMLNEHTIHYITTDNTEAKIRSHINV